MHAHHLLLPRRLPPPHTPLSSSSHPILFPPLCHLSASPPSLLLSLRASTARATHLAAALAPPPELTASEIDGDSSDGGPIEIPPSSSSSSSSSLFATSDNPTPLQLSTSVLLTGAISVFLFRSLRRRAKRAKEMRVRSSGVKDVKQEALDSLKAMTSATLDPGKPPSPVQALLGGLAAGAVAVILYKFTTTIEASLNRQTISDNFSVRQITITVRTIVNGLCYLATFVFGINSIGLLLYSGQLAISSFMEPDSSDSVSGKENDSYLNTSTSTSSSTNSTDLQTNTDKQKSADDS